MTNVFYLIILSSVWFLQSCSVLRPPVDLSVSSDTRAFEFLQERSLGVNSLKAELNINPSDIAIPSIVAYLSYRKDGVIRLFGLSPAGFTLFDLNVEDGVVTGSIDRFPAREIISPESMMEVFDFYGGDYSGNFTWFIEEMRDYYIVSQLKRAGAISFPLRRWWIDKKEMRIVKKELFSDTPEKQNVRLFEALYKDFRVLNGIMTPFEIIINNGSGSRIGKVRFKSIVFNEDIR